MMGKAKARFPFGPKIEQSGRVMQLRRTSFCVSALAIGVGLAARSSEIYSPYVNERFGYRVFVPTTLVSSRGESANGDGCTWKSRDGQITLKAWGGNNVFNRTLRGQMNAARREWAADHARFGYCRFTPKFYVLTGTTGDQIFYEKTVPQGDGFATMLWQFPVSRRARMDAVVTKTSRAFQGYVD